MIIQFAIASVCLIYFIMAFLMFLLAMGVVLTAPKSSLNALAYMTSSFFNNVDDADS